MLLIVIFWPLSSHGSFSPVFPLVICLSNDHGSSSFPSSSSQVSQQISSRMTNLLSSKYIGQTQQQPLRTFTVSRRYVLAINKTQCYGLESFTSSPLPRGWRKHSSTLASKSRTPHYQISPPITIPLPTTLVTVPRRCTTAAFIGLESSI